MQGNGKLALLRVRSAKGSCRDRMGGAFCSPRRATLDQSGLPNNERVNALDWYSSARNFIARHSPRSRLLTMIPLTDRLQLINRQFKAIKSYLDGSGYRFDRPDNVMPGPSSAVERIIARINLEVGAIPASITEFWRVVGSVDFCGEHPDWRADDFADAVVVWPPEAAEAELEDFIADRDEYTKAFGGFRIPISPDCFHKADVSGGMWYGIAIPDDQQDPPLLEERHETTFLNYLDIAMEWGGFPGIQYARNHSWPLTELKNAAIFN